MKTLFDYLSQDNQDRLVDYAKEHNLPVGRIQVQEHYNSPYYSVNAVGATGARQYQKINGQEYSWRKRIDYIARRVDIQLHHNFEAGIVQ